MIDDHASSKFGKKDLEIDGFSREKAAQRKH